MPPSPPPSCVGVKDRGGLRLPGGAGNLGDSRGGWLTGEALQDTCPLGECQDEERAGATENMGDPAGPKPEVSWTGEGWRGSQWV